MGVKYYLGTLVECQVIDSQISMNCGWPSGGTTNWDNPRQTTTEGVYAIQVPAGSHGFTKEQMMAGITAGEHENIVFPAGEL